MTIPTRYTCAGYRDIPASTLCDPSATAAALLFARREAHKLFGWRGDVRHVRLKDGTSQTFEAFVGTYDSKRNEWSGRNVWLTVRTTA